MTTALTGKLGEDTAATYLARAGYIVKACNVRFGRYEIDIVAEDRKENMLVFVEVKARTKSSDMYPTRTALDARKRRALREAVARYVTHHGYDGPARIDLLCVSRGTVTEHLVDIGAEFF